MAKPTEVVYAIRAGEFVKIGRTTDLATRMDALQHGQAVPIELLGVMPGGEHEERLFHQMFTARRQKGEWFALTEHDLGLLANVLPPPADLKRLKAKSRHRQRLADEDQYDRAERLHRCRVWLDTESSDGRIRCDLWRGHWGPRHTGGNYAWSDDPDDDLGRTWQPKQ